MATVMIEVQRPTGQQLTRDKRFIALLMTAKIPIDLIVLSLMEAD